TAFRLFPFMPLSWFFVVSRLASGFFNRSAYRGATRKSILQVSYFVKRFLLGHPTASFNEIAIKPLVVLKNFFYFS
ncbi:MAG: hypothetical protein Q4E17_05720, partial [Synergistes sp.]|nr:hypothetical protein [Synergistes sp.]